MSLPMQSTYNSQANNIGKAIKYMGSMQQRAQAQTPAPQPSRKSFNVSQYGNIAKSMPGAKTALGAVTTPFGGSTRYEGFHPGVDIANKIGTPVRTGRNVSGTVTEVVGGRKQGDKGFGNYVVVTDSQGNKYRYSHLAQGYVRVGQKVGPGTMIGAMGNTGSTYSLHGGTGSHLDFRVMDAFGRYISPYKFV